MTATLKSKSHFGKAVCSFHEINKTPWRTTKHIRLRVQRWWNIHRLACASVLHTHSMGRCGPSPLTAPFQHRVIDIPRRYSLHPGNQEAPIKSALWGAGTRQDAETQPGHTHTLFRPGPVQNQSAPAHSGLALSASGWVLLVFIDLYFVCVQDDFLQMSCEYYDCVATQVVLCTHWCSIVARFDTLKGQS